MCESCGCSGPEGGYKIFKPGEASTEPIITLASHHHHHAHADGSTHSHDHGQHTHNHPHSHSEHSHTIDISQDILGENNLMAERNRGYFEAKNILALNLVSSPGSGKTSLLVKTIQESLNRFKSYVIEGDQQTDNDARRIAATGVDVLQVNTGNACHLDSNMVHDALHGLKPIDGSVVFIENVGNLVCPAMFDLGEKKRVVIFSITEGEDKPLKYPNMFHSSDICLISKIDLLPHLDFDLELAKQNVLRVNSKAQIIEVSVKSGVGIDAWIDWILKIGK
jgi:hydrogenase nickel incorporation protein HypB